MPQVRKPTTQRPDHWVWITGASSGIGAELAKQWSQRGARLVLTARREAELHALLQQCENPESHILVTADLTNVDQRNSAINQVMEATGGIDTLVNNAGISQRSLAIDTDEAVYRRLMEINYFAPVALSSAVLPSMIKRGAGRIVTISSIAGQVGTPLRSGYCGAKHAIAGYMDSLRAEVAKQGVQVTVVYPGFIATEISRKAMVGDGSPQGHDDPGIVNGIAATDCAAKIIAATESHKPEVVIAGRRERTALAIKRISPRLLRRLVATADVT